MSRPAKEAYDLSDAEKRDLIALIQQGKPLPEKYRFILFEDKREVELVWNGKTRDVCTTVLPFQTLEHIDEPRSETKRQEELFDPRGRQLRGWTNKLIWGDNKLILSSLKSGALREQIEDAGGLKLIYIDPPYNTGKDFVYPDNFQDNIKNYLELTGQTEGGARITTNTDASGRCHTDWLNMIYPRLMVARTLLSNDGVIAISIGEGEVGNLLAICHEIFGEENQITVCSRVILNPCPPRPISHVKH